MCHTYSHDKSFQRKLFQYRVFVQLTAKALNYIVGNYTYMDKEQEKLEIYLSQTFIILFYNDNLIICR